MEHSKKQRISLKNKNFYVAEETIDLEELNRRQSALNVLESWDKQAMHAISSNTSTGHIRERMRAIITGINLIKKEL
ncbi:hypothetical protein PNEG_02703 [Pneumocystis murina B123]|uniref:Uncharacterized protein n=1 Tax=Pneumocystis murina (strain B123) TaxID=1069680 RepID=M7NNT6_PNEMU|nr:hypothetical protein PNEG_02703 [Pneumocystis murina B123]EMR08922.1 hypothetical protein PNEG_02703 [Pneumocystis murina B123]